MTRLYNKSQWHRRARRQLQREPLCAMCLAEGGLVAARIADHVEPHHSDPTKFWFGKLQSLCAHCHESRKKRGAYCLNAINISTSAYINVRCICLCIRDGDAKNRPFRVITEAWRDFERPGQPYGRCRPPDAPVLHAAWPRPQKHPPAAGLNARAFQKRYCCWRGEISLWLLPFIG